MRRMLLLAPLVLLAASAARAETGEAKEFKDKNFRWTLPSKSWGFIDLAPEQKSDQYVAAAELTGQHLKAFVRVVANGPTPSEISDEVRRSFGAELKDMAKNTLSKGTLSGVAGSVVVLQGKAANGGTMWFRGYATSVDRVLYQLLIQAYNGAEAEHLEEIAQLKRGFRLLKGAGPEEAPEKLEAGGDAAEPAAGDEPKGPFPPNGPKLEGRTAILPSHNLRWTLPDGSPFKWVHASANEKEVDQHVLGLRAEVPRKEPKEGEPRANLAQVDLFLKPRQAGADTKGIVNNRENQEYVAKKFFAGKVDASKTRIDLERKVGNYNGSSLSMAFSDGKTLRHATLLAVCLKGTLYVFEIQLAGAPDVPQTLGQPLGSLLAGLEFVDTKEHVLGPLAVAGIPPHNAERGRDGDKETDFTMPGLMGKKPKGVTELTFEGGNDPALRTAFEARSADGQAYFYFDVHTYDAAGLMRNKQGPEDIVRDRESQWKSGGGVDSVTVTKGKEPWFDATFAGQKGVGYHFTGSKDGFSFVEYGWVFKSKTSFVWVRTQYGGDGAEKVMEPQAKAMKKLKPT